MVVERVGGGRKEERKENRTRQAAYIHMM